MRVAILGNDRPSFVKPMTSSLSKMLNKLNVENTVFYNGTDILNYQANEGSSPVQRYAVISFQNMIKRALNIFLNQKYATNTLPEKSVYKLVKKLRGFDAVFVCAHMPITLAKKRYKGVDILKRELKVPIINYDLCFWATQGNWCQTVNSDAGYGGFTGFGRFDYYIAVSNTSEWPIKRGVPWPVTVVGGDFRSEELYPEQEDFRALIDFERARHIPERTMQLEVLQKLGIEYTILSGVYSQSELYKIFRKHSVYFLAHRESFGMPIVELQNCGCYILTPYKSWAPSHFINKSPYERGEGRLSDNFVVYDNDAEILQAKLLQLKINYRPERVLAEFREKQPYVHSGDLDALASVIDKIKTHRITNLSCLDYENLEDHIVSD
jgi:hypothetical protein